MLLLMAHGYDPNRFIDPIRQDYLCGICRCVLKDPRLCEAREHYFCLSCITQYLDKESQTCPECRKPLTLETLKCPQNFLPKILSELKIKCDYNIRGCPEFVELGKLEGHLSVCEYRPVMCDSCGLEVNEKDVDNHKESFCQLRRANMEAIEDIRKRQEEIMSDVKTIKKWQNQKELEKKNKPEETQNTRGQVVNGHKESNTFLHRCEISNEMRGIDVAVAQDYYLPVEIKKLQRNDVTDVTNGHREIHTFTNSRKRKMRSDMRRIHEREEDVGTKIQKVKKSLERDDQLEVANGQGESHTFTNPGRCEMKNEIKGIINSKQNELRMEMKKLKEDVVVIKQNVEVLLKRQLPELYATGNQNIFIFGGERETIPLMSVELYNIAKKSSKIVQRLKQPLVSSASCVHDNRILVSGGVGDEDDSDEIKVLNPNQHRQLATFGKLPVKLFGHDVIVHEESLYVIGGCVSHKRKALNKIYKMPLTPPHAGELVIKMLEPRTFHKAEIFNRKLFILGGSTTIDSKDALDSVVVYDLVKNEFTPRPSLPRPVSRMSTVTMGCKIFVLGGMDKRGRAINDVIMYDTESGQSERLPSMIHKRFGCSAVIMNDVIVVFGGQNKEQGCLNSVESFTIGGNRWNELPGMREKRRYATAVAKPRI